MYDHLDPKKFGLDQKFIDEANHTLREYDSWKIYCDSFEDGRERNQKEGNFFLAKLYQDNAAKVESKEVSESIISSPANHTRSRAQRRALIEELDQSPTKLKADANASKSLPTGSNGVKKLLALKLKDAREPPNGPDELPKTPSPTDSPISYQWGSPDSPAWIPNETFPKSIDEQIVNTALAAWILEHPNEPPEPIGRRFQVLQDRNEIFSNFARYGSKYFSYLRGEGAFDETDPESFMTIF
ncbi:uncharacterized protein ASPGLDRAFT_81751 [Aspergillus glaucus CBS 516.65]|uniref:Uncharacterized protein n=1 Tax=Aspergillus glaucus CBS 516.65 TaxID=1160497 RepID=A0A1L9VN19_ASPGL|nr:hypothetical protein ASPGLDRAFT_81751 [Aspergillus glaucus CBS 516.65]OJJ85315.1 hypothetical protein ASPGLDRAFT_81751 [Aspergillus glaucus CBS 516.65]